MNEQELAKKIVDAVAIDCWKAVNDSVKANQHMQRAESKVVELLKEHNQ